MKKLGLFLIFIIFFAKVIPSDNISFINTAINPAANALSEAVYTKNLGSSSIFYNPSTYNAKSKYSFYFSYQNLYNLVDYGTVSFGYNNNLLFGFKYSQDNYYSEYETKLSYRIYNYKNILKLNTSLNILYAHTTSKSGNIEGEGYGFNFEISGLYKINKLNKVSVVLRELGTVKWNSTSKVSSIDSKGSYYEKREVEFVFGYTVNPHKIIDINFSSINNNTIGTGLEFNIFNIFYPRAGFFKVFDKRDYQKITAGLGIKYNIIKFDVAYDINRWHNFLSFGIGFSY